MAVLLLSKSVVSAGISMIGEVPQSGSFPILLYYIQ